MNGDCPYLSLRKDECGIDWLCGNGNSGMDSIPGLFKFIIHTKEAGMNRFITKVVLISFLSLFASSGQLFCFALIEHHRKDSGDMQSPADIVMKYHDINAVRLAISNTGQNGLDVFTGNGAGSWPGSTPNNYVFGTGLWIGGIADVDGDQIADTLFLQAYDPISAGTEYQEGRYGQDPSDPLASVFRSTDQDDLANWPPEFSDPGGDPIVLSDQDLVTIYQSVNGTPVFATPNPPIEIRQRSLSFTTDTVDGVIYMIFDIENISDRVEGMDPFTIQDVWVGYDSDVDIGSDFLDDRTSIIEWQVTPSEDSIPVMTGFAWDEDFSESNFVGDPGFVGITSILSPGNSSDGIDNDGDGMIDESPFDGIDDDGDGVADDQPDEVDQLGLVHFTFFSDSGPGFRYDPQSDSEGYRIMSCTPPDECVETSESGDVRFMMTSGPFSMEPGQVHRLVIALVFANAVGDPASLNVYGDPPRPDPNDPVLADFVDVIRDARSFYDSGFVVGVEDEDTDGRSRLPRAFSLSQNYPNPFNPQTTIAFEVPESDDGHSRVTLSVSDIRGRHVRTLVDSDLEPGSHRTTWDGKNRTGEQVSSGIYFYTLRSSDGSFYYSRKMVLLK